MMQVNGDCVNILTQKRKTHAICQSNSLFRVCHVCYFDLLYLYITVIHSHIYIWKVYGVGGVRALNLKTGGGGVIKVFQNLHVVLAATELHTDTLFFKFFSHFQKPLQQCKHKKLKRC